MSGNHHIWVFGTVGIRMKAKKHVGARFAKKGSWVVTNYLLRKGKNGSSVDRCDYLKDKNSLLQKKAIEMPNSFKNRNPYGYCLGHTNERMR